MTIGVFRKCSILNAAAVLCSARLKSIPDMLHRGGRPTAIASHVRACDEKRITDEHVLFDLDTGKETLIESKFAGTIEEMEWLPDSSGVLAQAIEAAHTEVLKVDARTGELGDRCPG